MFLKTSTFIAAAIVGLSSLAHGTIVIDIVAGKLTDSTGAALPAGTLIQLVNIGDDGFDPINIADGSGSGINQWVSGNDVVLDIPFTPTGESSADFNSTSHFDFNFGTDAADSTIDRSFRFATGVLASGMKLGIRWFPGLTASDATFGSLSLTLGQQYGQYTIQSPSAPVNLGSLWVTPSEGGNVTFDSLDTFSAGGTQANALGQASFTVVPEPAAIGLSLLGAAGLATLRRRRG